MRKKDRKGFTLIELLVTIAVLSLVLIIAGVGVTKVLDKVEENEMKVTDSTIRRSAISYTEEFKLSDDYWFAYTIDDINAEIAKKKVTTEDEKEKIKEELNRMEYACTTVGMLINKGILKENILSKKAFDDKKNIVEISENTSVKIQRNSDTKVMLTEEIEYNSSECLQDSTITVRLEMNEEPNGNNNYYIKNNDGLETAEVLVKIENYEQVSSQKFLLTKNTKKDYSGDILLDSSSLDDNVLKRIEKDSDYLNANAEEYGILIKESGTDINFCLEIYSYKENLYTYCLKDKGQVEKFINIDYILPEMPQMTMNETNSGMILNVNGSIEEKKLKYFLNDEKVNCSVQNEQENDYCSSNSGVSKKLDELGSGNHTFTSYVEDYAGNKSVSNFKTLKIAEAESITPQTKYYCSVNETYYDNKDNAESYCYDEGEIYEETYYYCSLDEDIFDTDYDWVEEHCSAEGEPECDGYYEYDEELEMCVVEYNSNGWREHTFKCSVSKGYYVPQDNGYLNTEYKCDPCAGTGISCSLYLDGDYDDIELISRNDCEGDLSEYESSTNSEKKKNFSCSYRWQTYTYGDTCYNECMLLKKPELSNESGEVLDYTSYICVEDDDEYFDEDEAYENCYDYVDTSTKYYCSVTKKYYSNLSDAKSDCANKCMGSGDVYYNKMCYNFS